MKLKGKIAIITGAGSGIGRAQALLFAREGAKVVAIDIARDNVEKVAEEIRSGGGEALALQVNVTSPEEISSAVALILETFDRIDILSNTAGIIDGWATSLQTPIELWDKVISVNVRSIFLFTNAVLPFMLSIKQGVIINVASIGSFAAGAGGVAYTTSKHAVLGYTRQLTMDYAKDGIRVNAVAPGLIETPMVRDFFENADAGSEQTIQTIPARRPGSADEIAKAILFLASDDASYVFGSTLVVDGGVLARLK